MSNSILQPDFSLIKRKPMYRFLLVLTICSAICLQTWRTLFNNFAVDVVQIDGSLTASIQGVRELAGFLTFLIVFIILFMREHKLSALSIVLCGAGLAITGFFPSFIALIFTTFLFSIGFHYYEATNQTLTLQSFGIRESPIVFGKLRSLAAATNFFIGIIILIMIFVIDHFAAGTTADETTLKIQANQGTIIKTIYLIVGSIVVIFGIWGFFQNPVDKNAVPQLKRFLIRKKYWLFYTLSFLSGARRQFFVVFAVLLLVQKFHFSIVEITLLFIFNNFINYFLSPLVGRIINIFGERKVLTLEYFSMFFIFLAYAFNNSTCLVIALYVLDHIFFNFAIAIRTYFQKVADPRHIAPSMSVSFAINHIAAVIVPFIGAAIWMFSTRIPFIVGACLSILSLIFVQFIRTKPPISEKNA
ncbi:MAG: MFS transporter [Planctomycetes bacterium]|nr:MFS transporter [Planctomycetota bacterium]